MTNPPPSKRKPLQFATADTRGRITLGHAAARKTFVAQHGEHGTILLVPVDLIAETDTDQLRNLSRVLAAADESIAHPERAEALRAARLAAARKGSTARPNPEGATPDE